MDNTAKGARIDKTAQKEQQSLVERFQMKVACLPNDVRTDDVTDDALLEVEKDNSADVFNFSRKKPAINLQIPENKKPATNASKSVNSEFGTKEKSRSPGDDPRCFFFLSLAGPLTRNQRRR